MYVAGRDHLHRDPSRRFLERARAGDVDVCTSTEVLQEIPYRYAALKRLDPAGAVYDLFVQFRPTVLPVAFADTDRAKTLMTGTAHVSARDAIHAAVMLNHDIDRIVTFDTGFDRVEEIARLPIR